MVKSVKNIFIRLSMAIQLYPSIQRIELLKKYTNIYPLEEDEYARADVLGVLRRGIAQNLLGSGYDLRW